MNLQRKRKQVEEAKVEVRSAERHLKELMDELEEAYGITSVDEIEKKKAEFEKKLKRFERKKEKLEDKLDKLFEEIE